MILLRNVKKNMSKTIPSDFLITRNSGKSYENIADKLKINDTGETPVISDFFGSELNNSFYILVARYHNIIYISFDECRSFTQVKTEFHPSQITFHPTEQSYVLAYEQALGTKQVSFLADVCFESRCGHNG